MNESGVTSPETSAEPSPQVASIATTERSPVTGDRVNITPAARGADHPLHDDGHRDARLGQPQAAAVGDRLVVVERRPAPADVIVHRRECPTRRGRCPAVRRTTPPPSPRRSQTSARRRRCLMRISRRAAARAELRVPDRDGRVDVIGQRRAGDERAQPRGGRRDPGQVGGVERRTVRPAARPDGSMAAMAAANASTVTTNPAGTATPARASSPRLAPLPPTTAGSRASVSGPRTRRQPSAGPLIRAPGPFPGRRRPGPGRRS